MATLSLSATFECCARIINFGRKQSKVAGRRLCVCAQSQAAVASGWKPPAFALSSSSQKKKVSRHFDS